MLDLSPLPAFLPLALVVILAPGADAILLIRIALASGKRMAFAAFGGIHLGNIIATTLVASGLGTLIAHSPKAMRVIQLVGGLYLLWLAWCSARSAWAAHKSTQEGSSTEPDHSSTTQSFRRGLLTNVTNPKVLIFYISFLPQFLGHAHSAFGQLELLSAAFICLAMGWEAALILLASRFQNLMSNPRFTLTLEVLCTTAFTGLGVAILAM